MKSTTNRVRLLRLDAGSDAAPSPEANGSGPGYSRELAAAYETLKGSDDYTAWAGILANLIEEYGSGGNRLLDVGCGTGKSSRAMSARGYQVTGCDASNHMLAVARRMPANAGIKFLRADMRALGAESHGYDVVTWIDDVANHLLSELDLESSLRASCLALRPGGLLLLDANTVRTFGRIFASRWDMTESEATFTFSSPSDATTAGITSGQILQTTVSARHRGTDVRGFLGTIEERYFSPETVQSLMISANLEPVVALGLAGGGVLSPDVDEAYHSKVLHIARRA
jgi:SAM-dependent methyltransferase